MSDAHRPGRSSGPRGSVGRRQFLAAAAAAPFVLQAGQVRGAGANERIRLGIIGSGSRGVWIGDLFEAHGGYEVVAAADYFRDRVDELGERFGVGPRRRYTGLSCYEQLVAGGGLDAVAIMSPPCFHPDQTEAALEAGLHVFLAKPVAVDVAGSKRIGELGRRARQRQLVLLVDYQTRADPYYREAIRRVHEGALGRPAFGESTYHDNRLAIRAEPGTPEARLRNWVFWKDLSGDIITEQNVHTLDVMSWIMDRPPLRASGTGGRTVRVDVGDCWDHFTLVYEYADRVGVTFSSRQFQGHGSKPDGIRNRMFGSEGVLEAQYGGQVLIRGDHFYRGGATSGIFRDGAVRNIATFYEDVRSGRFENPTVEPSVRSNLVSILGRTAAYEGRTVTWEELLASNDRIEVDVSGLRA